MAFEFIRSETTDDGVLLITLDDPSTRNAYGGQLSEELDGEVDRFGQDPDLRVLVLTGADPAFCSGANVRGFNRAVQQREAQGPPPPPTPWERLDPAYAADHLHEPMGPAIVRKLWNLQKPSIAAVNGPAYGLGCGIALSCDIRIASESARFSEAFVRNGLIPADGSAWQLTPAHRPVQHSPAAVHRRRRRRPGGVPAGAVQQSRGARPTDANDHGASDAARPGADLRHVDDQNAGGTRRNSKTWPSISCRRRGRRIWRVKPRTTKRACKPFWKSASRISRGVNRAR